MQRDTSSTPRVCVGQSTFPKLVVVPKWPKLGRIRARVGRCRAKFSQVWLRSANCWTKSGECWSKSSQHDMYKSALRDCVEQMRHKSGPMDVDEMSYRTGEKHEWTRDYPEVNSAIRESVEQIRHKSGHHLPHAAGQSGMAGPPPSTGSRTWAAHDRARKREGGEGGERRGWRAMANKCALRKRRALALVKQGRPIRPMCRLSCPQGRTSRPRQGVNVPE